MKKLEVTDRIELRVMDVLLWGATQEFENPEDIKALNNLRARINQIHEVTKPKK